VPGVAVIASVVARHRLAGMCVGRMLVMPVGRVIHLQPHRYYTADVSNYSGYFFESNFSLKWLTGIRTQRVHQFTEL
jgi:hypothetical protein